MKNYHRIITLIPIIIFLTSASCKKDEIDTGFTCKVNGVRWRPFVDDFKLQETQCHFTNNNEELFVFARNTNKNEAIGFVIYTQGIKILIGKYNLDQKQIMRGFFDERIPGQEFRTGNGYSGILEIKSIDEINKRMIGTFYFSAFNETTKQKVEITSGTFNLRYVNY